MRDDEILPSGLANDARVRPVSLDVFPDGSPHTLKRLGRARKVNPRQVRMGHRRVADGCSASGNKIDHAGGEARGLEQSGQVITAIDGRTRTFPDNRVPHHCGSGREVPGDRSEIERRDRKNEPLQGPVIQTVPHAGARQRLVAVNPFGVVGVETPEIDQFARGVNLGLNGGLALAQDGRGIQGLAPGPCQEFGRPQEHGLPGVDAPGRPFLMGLAGRFDRLGDFAGAGFVPLREDVSVVVWNHLSTEVAGPDFLAADQNRDFDLLGRHVGDPLLECNPLRRAGGV